MCLKEPCFPDWWKVSSVFPVLKNVEFYSYKPAPFSLLSKVSKVFKELVNNTLVDHLDRCGFFLISSMVSRRLDQLQIIATKTRN